MREPLWYFANSADSEHWYLGGDTPTRAIACARRHRRALEIGDRFVVAPEVVVEDAAFWRSVASVILDHGVGEYADECLAEENLVNPEEGWLDQASTWVRATEGGKGRRERLEVLLAVALSQVLKRPGWAHVATDAVQVVEMEEPT